MSLLSYGFIYFRVMHQLEKYLVYTCDGSLIYREIYRKRYGSTARKRIDKLTAYNASRGSVFFARSRTRLSFEAFAFCRIINLDVQVRLTSWSLISARLQREEGQVYQYPGIVYWNVRTTMVMGYLRKAYRFVYSLH